MIVSPDRLEVDITSTSLFEAAEVSGFTGSGGNSDLETADCGVPEYGTNVLGVTSVHVLTGLGTQWYSVAGFPPSFAIPEGGEGGDRIKGLRLLCQEVHRVELPPEN